MNRHVVGSQVGHLIGNEALVRVQARRLYSCHAITYLRCSMLSQEKLGFDVDPNCVLISFVGRWAYEKGIDLMAEATIWMLRNYENVQVFVVGPPGDESGQWAASKLVSIAKIPAIAKRLFVKAEFFMVTSEMRFASDFTICPSRTEPFGYVDGALLLASIPIVLCSVFSHHEAY